MASTRSKGVEFIKEQYAGFGCLRSAINTIEAERGSWPSPDGACDISKTCHFTLPRQTPTRHALHYSLLNKVTIFSTDHDSRICPTQQNSGSNLLKTSRTACSLAPIYLLSNSGPYKNRDIIVQNKSKTISLYLWKKYKRMQRVAYLNKESAVCVTVVRDQFKITLIIYFLTRVNYGISQGSLLKQEGFFCILNLRLAPSSLTLWYAGIVLRFLTNKREKQAQVDGML